MRRSSNLSSTIESIRPRFLEETAQRLGRIRAVRPALDRPDDLNAALTEIRFGAHKTTGIAATLGFSGLGRAAQEVDAALTDYDGRDGTVMKGPLPEQVTELVDAMIEEMARVAGPQA